MKATPVNTLNYLGHAAAPKRRLIVAGMFMRDGRLIFVDSNNCVLLITNPKDETVQEFDLLGDLPEQGIKPTDVNYGFDDDQLLVTYTGEKISLGVIFKTTHQDQKLNLKRLLIVKVPDRARSMVVLDANHICACAQFRIIVLNKDGDEVASHDRQIRDRGGLLMCDGKGRFYYGDRVDFVCCQWNGQSVVEIFRFKHPRMKVPRGSTVDASGWIVVCCESHTIFRISNDGSQSEVIESCQSEFGDVDFHPTGNLLITTYWQEDLMPVLYKIEP